MPDPILLELNGDVVGPVSAVDNSMVLFDGTTGKLIKGNNAVVTAAGLALLDDNNATEQRNTLGLGSMATQNSNAVTVSGGTITGITDLTVADGGTGASTAAQARTNLGILFGTTAGTYMEGNDLRVVNAVPNTRQVIAGSGLTGGGALSADRTLTLGTPSTVGASSTNSASGNTHTHALDMNSLFSTVFGETGSITLPNKLCIQWSSTARYNDLPATVTDRAVNFNFAFAEVYQVFGFGRDSDQNISVTANNITPSGFTARVREHNSNNTSGVLAWIAIGKAV